MVYAVIKKKSTYQLLQLLAIVLLPWGLFFSEAMTSILIIVFAFPLVLFGAGIDRRELIRETWPFLLIYAILLISGFWSRDSGRWFNLLRVSLPYVALPVAFALWPHYLRQRRNLFIRQFVFAGVALSLYLVFLVVIQPEQVLSKIREGGSFQMPVHHVQTSLFLAIAGVLGWDEWSRHGIRTLQYWLFGVGMVVIIAGIHLLAVRTGLVLFYLGSIGTFLWNKNYHQKHGVMGIGFFGVLMVMALLFIPSVREKWQYFLEDFRNYEGYSWWFYSDAVRWKSNLMGWEIFQESPWWGVGMGDVLDEMHTSFYNLYEIRIWEYPHNLWITFLAGSGVIGFLLLNLALGKLFIQARRSGSLVFRLIFFLYLISCLVENTLLTSLGTASFVLILLIAIDSVPGEVPADREQN